MDPQDTSLRNLDGGNNRFFRELFDKLPAAAYMCDAAGLITYFNPYAESLWGRAPRLHHPDDRFCGSFRLFWPDGSPMPHGQCWMARALGENVAFTGCDVTIERPDGRLVNARAHANPFHDEHGKLIGAINVLVDVTERSRVDRVLQQIAQAVAPATGDNYFRELANHLCRTCRIEWVLIGEVDRDDPQTVQSIAVSHKGAPAPNLRYHLVGTPSENVIAGRFCQYPQHVAGVFPSDRMLADMGIEGYLGCPLHTARGRPTGLLVLMHTRPIDEAEVLQAIMQVVAVRASAELERMHASVELHEEKEQLRLLMEHSPFAIQVFAADGTLERVNRTWEEMWGPIGSQLVGRYNVRTDPRVDELGARPFFDAAFAGLTPPVLDVHHAPSTGGKGPADGRVYPERWLRMRGYQVPGPDGGLRHLVVLNEDITGLRRASDEQRRLESHLQHAEKLKSLGVLAGGIAHDFNNLLTSVLGLSGLGLMQLPPDSPVRGVLGEIEQAAHRASDLTRQMLDYSGRGRFAIESLRLDQLVREMADLLKTAVSRKASLALEVAPARVEADATQVRQIVMNLITNASDALDGNVGTIRVRTGVRHADSDDLRSDCIPDQLPAGEYAFVEVQDNGCGMTPDTVAHMFDPFFTTRFTGRGLGLAAVLGIVRGHKGSVKVETAPGAGTTMTVMLPAARTAPATPATPTAPATIADSPLRAGEAVDTVLVVDDEPGVLSVSSKLLEMVGLTVLTAPDGQAGLDLFVAHRDRISLVLLDLTMPRLDGLEVLRRLQALGANVPVLVMSGFNEREVSTRVAGTGASGFIKKPFLAPDLIARVTAMLRAAGKNRIDG
ncbi:MAG: response regulator [Planctomycetota bacterium]